MQNGKKLSPIFLKVLNCFIKTELIMHAWKKRALAKRKQRSIARAWGLPCYMLFPKAKDFIKIEMSDRLNVPKKCIEELKEKLNVAFTNNLLYGSLEVQI